MPTSLLLSGAAQTGGPKYYASDGAVGTLRNAGAWTLALWIRADSLLNTDVGNPVILFARLNGSPEIQLSLWEAGGTPRLQFGAYLYEAGAASPFDLLQSPQVAPGYGSGIHLVFTFNEGGDKKLRTYVNTELVGTSSASSLTDPRVRDVDRAIRLGLGTVNGTSLGGAVALDGFGLWASALNSADRLALFGGADPATVGSPAVALPFSGAADSAATLGDAGFSAPGVLAITSGAGAAVYKAAIVYQAPVVVDLCHVGASRKSLIVSFKDRSGNRAYLTRPQVNPFNLTNLKTLTLTVNGTPYLLTNYLAWPADDREDWFAFYPLPATVPEGATVTVSSAGAGVAGSWAKTDRGDVEALANRPVPLADPYHGLLGPLTLPEARFPLGVGVVEDQGVGQPLFADLATVTSWRKGPGVEVATDPATGEPIEGGGVPDPNPLSVPDTGDRVWKGISAPSYGSAWGPSYDDPYYATHIADAGFAASIGQVTGGGPLGLMGGMARFLENDTLTVLWDGPHAAATDVFLIFRPASDGLPSAASVSDGGVVSGAPTHQHKRVYTFTCHRTPGKVATPYVELWSRAGNGNHRLYDSSVTDFADPPIAHPAFAATSAGYSVLRPMHYMSAAGDASINGPGDYTQPQDRAYTGQLANAAVCPLVGIVAIAPVADLAATVAAYPFGDGKRGYSVAEVTTAAPHLLNDGDQFIIENLPGPQPSTHPADGGEASPMALPRASNVRVTSPTKFLMFKRSGGAYPEGTYGTLQAAVDPGLLAGLTGRKNVRRSLPIDLFCDLGAELDKDVWLHPSSIFLWGDTSRDAAFTSLMTQIANRLPAGKKLYLETPNEMWNLGALYHFFASYVRWASRALPGSGATATCAVAGGVVTGVTLTAPGSGYLEPVYFDVYDNELGGFGARGWGRVSGGQVVELTLTNPGNGLYNAGASVRIVADPAAADEGRPATGSGAAGTPIMSDPDVNGKRTVVGLTITAPGSGYSPRVVVTFTGGGGHSACRVATVAGGQITGSTATITGTGADYTSTPAAVFTPLPIYPDQYLGSYNHINPSPGVWRAISVMFAKAARLAKAAFVAAGRPASDVVFTVGTWQGVIPQFEWVTDLFRCPWTTLPDLVVTNDYWRIIHPWHRMKDGGGTPYPDAPDTPALGGQLDRDQSLDLLELSLVPPGQDSQKYANVRAYLDAFPRPIPLGTYECGIETIVLPNLEEGSNAVESSADRQAYMAKHIAASRHPRMRRMHLGRLKLAHDNGAVLYTTFSHTARDFILRSDRVPTNLSYGAWIYPWVRDRGEVAGLGDGTDGKNDNRANPWEPGVSVSTRLSAMEAWAGVPAGPEAPARARVRWFPRLRSRVPRPPRPPRLARKK